MEDLVLHFFENSQNWCWLKIYADMSHVICWHEVIWWESVLFSINMNTFVMRILSEPKVGDGSISVNIWHCPYKSLQ